jgi:hypothetical protein
MELALEMVDAPSPSGTPQMKRHLTRTGDVRPQAKR